MEIIIKDLKGFKVAMTSLQVAELTGKEHRNVTSDIEDEMKKLGAEISLLIFQQSDYTNERGKTYKMYNLSRDGAMQLGARYDAVTRFKMIQRINELENEISNRKMDSYMIENPIERAKAWIVEEETRQQLALDNIELSTKLIEAKDNLNTAMTQINNLINKGSRTTFSVSETAKLLGYKDMGEKKLFQFLKDKDYMTIRNIPAQKMINESKMIALTKYNQYIDENYVQARLTVKGIFWLGGVLERNGYETIVTQDALVEQIDKLIK